MRKCIKSLFGIFIGTLLIVNTAYSMGGDKPGPNGGYISMPGTYHIELVPRDSKFRIYLLDMNMKNPVVKNSMVSLKLITGEQKGLDSSISRCRPMNNYFECERSNKNMDKYKAIEVESIRNKIKAPKAIYKLPLKFE